jgi:hypothetical protein
MRRGNFLVAAITALITFVSLSVFVGHRHWGWHRWNGGCEYYEQHQSIQKTN